SPSPEEKAPSPRRNQSPPEHHQPNRRGGICAPHPVCGSNGQIVQNEQVPTDGPHPEIGPRLDPLEVGEKARGKCVDRQDTERKNANVHDGAVYHWAVSPHLCLGWIFEGSAKGIAASGFLISPGSSR